MKFFLYEGRHGERLLTEHSRTAWNYLLAEMNTADGCTIEEAREEGFWVDGGTYEDGHVSVDDGGKISTVELTRVVPWKTEQERLRLEREYLDGMSE